MLRKIAFTVEIEIDNDDSNEELEAWILRMLQTEDFCLDPYDWTSPGDVRVTSADN